jgi:hypothetical protein
VLRKGVLEPRGIINDVLVCGCTRMLVWCVALHKYTIYL